MADAAREKSVANMAEEKIPTLELVCAAERELSRRRAEYPSEVTQGMKTQPEADYEISCQAEIVATLERMEKLTRTIPQPTRPFSNNFVEMFDD